MNTTKTKMRSLIVQEALVMFKTLGIKAVRMDDVAKELKISKRTLYEHFEDKEHLLLECLRRNADEQSAVYKAYAEQSEGVMDMLCFFLRNALEELRTYNPKFYVEVVKYQSVRDFIEERSVQQRVAKQAFVQQGIEEGLILGDINFELLHHLNKCAVDSLIREKLYEKHSLREIFHTFVMVFLRGMLTEKGLKEFNRRYLEEL